jgi:predicted  nucleic acid-binding Zn-ribbon protein
MQEKIQEKFNELSKNITKLQEKAGDVGSDIKDKSNGALEALSKKRDAVQQTIKKCTSASAETWENLKSGLETALEDLENSYTKAASYLEQKRENLYVSHIEEKLNDFDQKIEELRNRINKIEPELKTTLIEALARVREKYETARSKLEDLQSAEPESWEASKSDMYAMLEDMDAAYNTTVAYFPEYQEEYQQRLETTLTDLDRKIAALQKKADKAKTDNNTKINESIQRLRKRQVAARNKYREFQVASVKVWQEFKAEMDTMIEDLERSYDETSSLFTR